MIPGFIVQIGRRTRHAYLLGALLVVLLASLAGCGSSPAEDAVQRWQDSGVEDYRLRVREVHSIWCYYDLEVTVQDGQVVSATAAAHPGPARQCWHYDTGDVIDKPVAVDPGQAEHLTVPALLEMAQKLEALQGEKDWDIELEFDAELGYPLRLLQDNVEWLDDDGLIAINEFEVLAR